MARFRAVVMIQPAGLGGTPADGPVPDGEGKSILDGVLGGVDVPEHAGQDGYRAAVFLPEHAGDVRLRSPAPLAGLRAVAGIRRRSRTWLRGPSRLLVLEGTHFDGQGGGAGQLPAQPRAASRSAASMTVNPPRCSFASAKGPSVMSTSAPCCRTTVAVLRGMESGREHPGAGGLHFAVQGLEVTHDRLQEFRGRGGADGLVNAEQVLCHGGVLLDDSAGSVPASHLLDERHGARIDTPPAIGRRESSPGVG